ncbi:MAG: dipeptidase [Lachnospiraceae bacterium]|nr:dipeptidase [Lachnospiraceae bacterium]
MYFADFHCDTISELYEHQKTAHSQAKPWTLMQNPLQVDLPRLRDAGYLLQHFAIFIDMGKYENPYNTAMQMLDLYDRELAASPELVSPVYNLGDINKIMAEHKIAAIATIEEGGILEGDLSRLDALYKRGVRLLTLTWNYPNCIGYPNAPLSIDNGSFPITPDTIHGLTPFGFLVVEKCESLGIVVDVSHLSDAGFYDVADVAKRPFVASHSSARALSPHARNASDDMIRVLAEHGGLIGVNFHPPFIEGNIENPYGTIAGIVKHIRHIYRTGGISCLALGSDFDGINRHLELDDAAMMPKLFYALKKDGFSESQIDAILYKNMLQFYNDYLPQ